MTNRIKVSCSKDNLKEIRVFVTETLKNFCVPELEISMLVLAVDEICANRIIHSNNNNSDTFIELAIKKIDSSNITFEIIDKGEVFDHSKYIEPDINQLIQDKRKGGLGLMLVKRIMDSIEVKKENDHTICLLTKKVKTC